MPDRPKALTCCTVLIVSKGYSTVFTKRLVKTVLQPFDTIKTVQQVGAFQRFKKALPCCTVLMVSKGYSTVLAKILVKTVL